MNEAETRAELIDPALRAAGWGVVADSRVRRETICPGRIEGAGRRGKPEIADYVLTFRNHKLAVIEAKARDKGDTEGIGQAKAYADYYIQVHMDEASGGRTYSQVSGGYMAALKSAPTAEATAELGQLRQTLFMGTTLRGMLLNAYAFGTIATIAMWAAVAAFVGAAFLLVLGALGLRHAKEVTVTAPARQRIPATA